MRRHLGVLARALFGIAGLAFLAVAFWRTWDRSTDVVVPQWWRLVAAFVLLTVAMALAYRAWAQLLPRAVRARPLAAGFFVAQLGKYVPGAVWQAVGQVGYATRAEVSLPRAATAFAVFAFTQAGAGALVGAGVAVLVPGLAWWLRLAAVAGLAFVVLLDRRWMVWAIGVYRRHRPAPGGNGTPDDLVPDQAAILRSCAWSIGVVLAMSTAFVVLVGGLATGVPAPAAVSAHALAWTAGFLAVPVPSGLGVREAILIVVLGPSTGAAELIAASVYFRLAQMLAELVLIVLSRQWRRGRVGRGPATGASPRER